MGGKVGVDFVVENPTHCCNLDYTMGCLWISWGTIAIAAARIEGHLACQREFTNCLN